MSRVVVIGAGVMGLAAAYRLSCAGHQVDVLEAAPDPGGMAGHFDFDGISIERFYHFVCKTDTPTFSILKELGLDGSVRWVPTSMGLFTKGHLYPWGDPISLLRLPHISLIDKLRYAVFAFTCTRRNRWDALEHETAKEWIVRWCGQRLYDQFWKPLFDYKFYEYAENISAAWIWTRIRRIGRSRKNVLQEELGYIEGGSITLVNALMSAIVSHGGRVHLGKPVTRVVTENGRVRGVQSENRLFPADHVISTAPTPYVSALVPDLPDDWKRTYEAIPNIGVICVLFKLKRSVSKHFWINIAEPGVPIPGIIEFSNLRKAANAHIVYVPYYMPVTRDKFSWPDQRLIDEAFECIRMINPSLQAEDILATKVARLRHGQPICEPGFNAKIPPVQTPIDGLQIADTCFYYPEDRGIAESVRLGCAMADQLGKVSTAAQSSAVEEPVPLNLAR